MCKVQHSHFCHRHYSRALLCQSWRGVPRCSVLSPVSSRHTACPLLGIVRPLLCGIRSGPANKDHHKSVLLQQEIPCYKGLMKYRANVPKYPPRVSITLTQFGRTRDRF
ncbi:hypothetical protein J6590_053640 [Homalodisca vitripennis]|nr:hypothetical protein J6590_053640 [Homalodisca vitripennis]